MNPQHRYVILCSGKLVYNTNDKAILGVYLWGRDIRDGYVVLDYEKPYPVDTPDLVAWLTRLAMEQPQVGAFCTLPT